MTKDQITPAEAFVAKVARAHPHLRLACDAPEQATESTWIDIRAGAHLIVVEYKPGRGFGFAAETHDSTFYGTPSAVFFRDVGQACAHLEQLLDRTSAIEAGEAARHGT